MVSRKTHRGLIVLAAYGAYTLAPLAHHVIEPRDVPCEHCSESPIRGWALVAECDGPCGDPSHHHHHSGHHPDHCLVCQSHAGVRGILTSTPDVSDDDSGSRPIPLIAAVARSVEGGRSDVIRGPPCADFAA